MKLLVMRDPVTKLAIVDPTTVDPAVAKLLPSVFFVLNQRIPLTYYISRFTSKGRFGFSENRVMLVSNSVLFVFDDPTGSLNRCIPISAISAVLLFQDGFHALKIPSEHDMVFKLQNVQETNYFVNILSVAKSFLPVPEGQSSNELTVKASGGTYSDLTGRDALVLSKKADAQYATTPIPTIRFVDAQKGDTIAQFLKPPPPPSSKGAAAASVAKDSDKIQQVLQHPLFHPSGVVPKTSEEIKLAQLAVAQVLRRRSKRRLPTTLRWHQQEQHLQQPSFFLNSSRLQKRSRWTKLLRSQQSSRHRRSHPSSCSLTCLVRLPLEYLAVNFSTWDGKTSRCGELSSSKNFSIRSSLRQPRS